MMSERNRRRRRLVRLDASVSAVNVSLAPQTHVFCNDACNDIETVAVTMAWMTMVMTG
jgi:hypothetical protein